MRSANKMYRAFRSSDGRVKVATLSGIGLLAAALVLVLAVLPASAFQDSDAGVPGITVNLGGQPDDCPAVGSTTNHELRIENPVDGTVYPLPDDATDGIFGASVLVSIRDDADGNELLDYAFSKGTSTFDVGASDVVIKGGQKSNHYDNVAFAGVLTSDANLHAPKKGQSLYNISHVSFCFGVVPVADLTVTKTPVRVNETTFTDPVPNPFPADIDDQVEFRIRVKNADGPDSNAAATDVEVVDTLPPGMEFDATTPEVFELDYDEVAGQVSWTIPSIAIDDFVDLRLFVTITEAAAGTAVENTVTATGMETDPTSGVNNENVAGSVPKVTVNATLSGRIFIDKNVNSILDAGDTADLTATLRLYSGDIEVTDPGLAATYTEVEGDPGYVAYSYTLPPGTYTVCLEENAGFEQTIPDRPDEPSNNPVPGGVVCSDPVMDPFPGDDEPAGYERNLNDGSSTIGNDFGNFFVFPCDGFDEAGNINLDGIEGTFAIFSNKEIDCNNKAGEAFEGKDNDGNPVVGILLDGSGEAVGRAEIARKVATPLAAGIDPLLYSLTQDGTYSPLPWCNFRGYEPLNGDGPEFVGDIGNTWYPDLSGLDAQQAGIAINCKVTEEQDLLGNIVTVVFFYGVDPFYRG